MERLENFYKGKNVLVTGGAGFIGSHITEKLISLGAHVSVLDNFSTGNIKNLNNVLTQITLHYADITCRYSLTKATINKDMVFHFAAFASVPQSIENPNLCYKINIVGTKNLLEECYKNSVKTIVFASSASVYGNKNEICSENDIPSPENPYAKSKLEGEKICKQYSSEFNINTAILRYFNVYGSRQNPSGEYSAVAAKFKKNLQEKKSIVIFGDGNQTRDFIDVSQANLTTLKIGMLQNFGEIFNVASGKSINLFSLIKKLEDQHGKATDITFKPARKGDVSTSKANCAKYKSLAL
jgi:nucleoside-diphosphate-sugar epimerase